MSPWKVTDSHYFDHEQDRIGIKSEKSDPDSHQVALKGATLKYNYYALEYSDYHVF
jgi:hypothetical protein